MSIRRFDSFVGLVLRGFLALSGSGVVACSTESPATNSDGSIGEIVVEASSASQAELGVVEWRSAVGGHGKVTVHGVDGNGSPLVELLASWHGDDNAYRSEHRLTRAGSSASLKLSVTRTAPHSATVDIDNELGRAPEALRRAYELLNADLEAGPTLSGSPFLAVATIVTAPLSLHPNDSTPLITTDCPTALTCKKTALTCVKGPVKVISNCYPGKTAAKLVLKVGKKLVKSLLSDNDASDFDPIGDCVDAVTNTTSSCDSVDENCNPQSIGNCDDAQKRSDEADQQKKQDCSYCEQSRRSDCGQTSTDGTYVPSCADSEQSVTNCYSACQSQGN